MLFCFLQNHLKAYWFFIYLELLIVYGVDMFFSTLIFSFSDNFFKILFIFGCVGSSLLCASFL